MKSNLQTKVKTKMSEQQVESEGQDFKAGENGFAHLGREDEPATREPTDSARTEAMARAASPDMTTAAELQHASNNPMEGAATVIRDGKAVGTVGVTNPKEAALTAEVHRNRGKSKANQAAEAYDTLQELTDTEGKRARPEDLSNVDLSRFKTPQRPRNT
jgi:ribosomal protein S16